MRFRAKILLSILLPASLLVATAVSAAVIEMQRGAREAVLGAFDRAQKAVAAVLQEQRTSLEATESTLKSAWFDEFVDKGSDPEGRTALSKALDQHLIDVDLRADYLAAGAPDGSVWTQRYFSSGHTCYEPCRHPVPARWAKSPQEVLFNGLQGFYLGRRIDYSPRGAEGGGLVIGKILGPELDRLVASLDVQMDLVSGGQVVYSSFPKGSPGGRQGDVWSEGKRYVASTSSLAELGQLVLYRSMAPEDAQRRRTILFGGVALALAVLVAALVSTRVSSGISRPVESLVRASRQVGAGDYSVQVSIPGSDEMATLGTAFNEMTEGLRKRREIMEKTLSRDVAEELMKGVELGGERRRVTILFTDVRGFTSGTEGVDPAEVVTMLNDMMNFLAEAISKQGGNVNKFLGDGIMAMFGAPKDLPDHAFRAVQAALEMQKEMAAWNVRRSGRGLPPFNVGIGINTGTVLGGKVGSRNRLEYTLIGEEVNLSSRICGKAAPGQVLVTKATLAELGDRVRVRELEPVHVKGLSYPVSIYEVQG